MQSVCCFFLSKRELLKKIIDLKSPSLDNLAENLHNKSHKPMQEKKIAYYDSVKSKRRGLSYEKSISNFNLNFLTVFFHCM